MSVRLKNIISDFNDAKDTLIMEEIKAISSIVAVQQFDAGFKGIIGQINVLYIEDEFYDDEAIMDKVFAFEEDIRKISQKFPKKRFAFIDVDCFGGVCLYEGFIVQNGVFIHQEKASRNAHIALLKFFLPNYNNWFFEPFTRGFF